MTVDGEIRNIEMEIKKEINEDIDLSIGSIENPSEAAPVLCDRMDRVCSLMSWQSSLISAAEKAVEEAKYQFKKKELSAKKKYNESLIKFKQDDRIKPRNQRRTDPEYISMAELESNIELNESLSAEKEYLHSQHKLDDAKHYYEILNNHFLSYRKATDLLIVEMKKLGDPRDQFPKRTY